MKRLFILRAAPATGKSTWIEENTLGDITVSSDEWRLKLFGIEENENGKPGISQKCPWVVWGKVKGDIASRMSNGGDIILDACARTTKDIKTWRKLVDEYGYDAYVVEFYHDVDADICKKRNLSREAFRQVPEYVIDNFFDTVHDNPVPEGFTTITPDEALELLAIR